MPVPSISAAVALVVAAVLVWWLYFRTIPIDDPCNAFATSFTSQGKAVKSPRLMSTDGSLALAVPYTPADHPAANDIYYPLERRPRSLRISATGRELRGLGSTPEGELLVRVDSMDEARAVLSELCFKPGDEAFASLKLP